MKEIKLTLSIKKAIQRIELHSYYTGEARKKAGIPEELAAGMQASTDDSVQLNDHISSTIGELSRIISRFFGICSVRYIQNIDDNNTQSVEFSLTPPFNYPIETIPQITEAMENYAVMRTLYLWLLQHKPDEAGAVGNEAMLHSNHLRELFALRKRPKKITKREDNIVKL